MGIPEVPFGISDISGKRFGDFTVRMWGGWIRTSKHPRRTWCCVCSCGNIRRVREDALVRGTSKSCGCLRSKLMKARNPGKPGIPPTPSTRPYPFSLKRVAEIFEISESQANLLPIKRIERNGEAWFSAQSLGAVLANQNRSRKACKVLDSIMLDPQITQPLKYSVAFAKKKILEERMPWPEEYFRVSVKTSSTLSGV